MPNAQFTARALIVGCFAVALTPGTVFAQQAADVAAPAPSVKAAPAPAPAAPRFRAPAFTWSGFYIGGNVGYGGGDAVTAFSVPDFDDVTFEPASINPEPMGWTFGFQGGMNFRWSGFVAGFEADFSKSDIAGDTSHTPFTIGGEFVSTGVMTSDQSLNWISTFRGRFGVATDRLLFYGTAGLAVGHLDHRSSLADDEVSFPVSEEKTQTGWTIGAGVEGAINSHMTWRAQYLYFDLGETSATDPLAGFKHTWKSTNSTFSGGINFKF